MVALVVVSASARSYLALAGNYVVLLLGGTWLVMMFWCPALCCRMGFNGGKVFEEPLWVFVSL